MFVAPWIVGVPIIVPLMLDRARIVVPDTPMTFDKGW